jgi:hypothetical protein
MFILLWFSGNSLFPGDYPKEREVMAKANKKWPSLGNDDWIDPGFLRFYMPIPNKSSGICNISFQYTK